MSNGGYGKNDDFYFYKTSWLLIDNSTKLPAYLI